MGIDYINLKEAVRRSGLHSNMIQRLLREGVLDGYKTRVGGASLVRIGYLAVQKQTPL